MLKFIMDYISKAKELAKEKRNEFITAEHIMYLLLEDPDCHKLLDTLKIDCDILKKDMKNYFEETQIREGYDVVPTLSNCMAYIMDDIDEKFKQDGYVTFIDLLDSMYRMGGKYFQNALDAQNVYEVLSDFNSGIHNCVSDLSGKLDNKLPSFIAVDTVNPPDDPNEEYEAKVEYLNDKDDKDNDPKSRKESNAEKKQRLQAELPYAKLILSCNEANPRVPFYIPRENYIRQITLNIGKRFKHNNCLYGEPGVGKDSIIWQVMSGIEDQVHLIELDIAKLVSSAKLYTSALECMQVIKQVCVQTNRVLGEKVCLLRIKNLDIAMDANSGSIITAVESMLLDDNEIGNSVIMDVSEKTASLLMKREVFKERVNFIKVDAPVGEDLKEIIRSNAYFLTLDVDLDFDETAYEKAWEIAKKSDTDDNMIDATLSILEEVAIFSDVAFKGGALVQKNVDKMFKNYIDSHGIDDAVVERVYNIIHEEQAKEKADLSKVKDLSDNLKKEIFGQDKAINELVKNIEISKAGLNKPNKPIGSFMFVGSTGTGKTQTAKSLAKSMNMHFLKFDMSEFSEQHSTAKLIGAPPGYVGYEEGGSLVESIRKHPDSVVLFDEIEKAHPVVYNVLLQIMDDAVLTDGRNRKADFRNSVIIMTSNAGAAEVKKNGIGFGNTDFNNDAMTKAVKTTFKPEFIARLSAVIEFNDLNKSVYDNIVDRELKELQERMADRHIKLGYDDEVRQFICEKVDTKTNGARGIESYVKSNVASILGHGIVSGAIEDHSNIRLYVDGDSLNFKMFQ